MKYELWVQLTQLLALQIATDQESPERKNNFYIEIYFCSYFFIKCLLGPHYVVTVTL